MSVQAADVPLGEYNEFDTLLDQIMFQQEGGALEL